MSGFDDIEELDEVAASGLFDAEWYLSRYDDIRASDLSPSLHFHRHGWQEGRWPNRYFDPQWYLESYPDVRDAGMNPLVHYLRHGDEEGRRPVWHFDPIWYRTAHELAPDTLALTHFLEHRTTGQYAPSPALYAVPLLAAYREDVARGEDPYAHYLDDMLREGREVLPDLDVVAASTLVDPNYYLINGSDVHEAALDPGDHFCRHGWREGRKPNIYFDTRWYLQTNPDVARQGINPLMHYVLVGEATGRRPVAYFDPVWYRETYAIPEDQGALAHFLVHRRGQKFSPTPMFDIAWYVSQHGEEMGTNRDPFAHFLQTGTYKDVDPSPTFSAAAYRRRHIGRISRRFRHLMHPDKDNPLIHYLRTQYR